MARRRTLVLAGCLLIAAETDVVIYNLHAAVAGYPVERFVADFDRNIQNVPIAAEIIAHDAAFRKRVIRATAKNQGAPSNSGGGAACDAIGFCIASGATDGLEECERIPAQAESSSDSVTMATAFFKSISLQIA